MSATADAPLGNPASHKDTPPALTPPRRVLLIEDEPGIVDFVKRGLQAEGFIVEAALDGVTGEQLAVGGGFDAVFLDLMLP